MNRSRLLRCAALCSLLAVSAAQAEVYKWVDKQGHIHYSDRPQAGWTRVDVSPSANTQKAAPPADADADEASEGEQEQARRAAACEDKKKQLDGYTIATRIVEKNALGGEREYSAEERQQLIDLTQKQVGELCGEPQG